MGGVTIICPNNRRVVVKFEAPSKTLFQILDEACKKQGYEREKYGLKHHNRFVDLSLPFRLSGLPQNCTLEMAECPNPNAPNSKSQESSAGAAAEQLVQIALQLTTIDGRRLIGNVPSDATLLDVLLDFEKSNSIKLVEPAENDHDDLLQPVCHYLQEEFVGVVSLGSTTLKQLGLIRGGRGLIRYSTRRVDPVKMREINENVERSKAKLRKLDANYEQKLRDNIEFEKEQKRRQAEEEAVLEKLRQQQQREQELQKEPKSVSVDDEPSSEIGPPDTVPKSSFSTGAEGGPDPGPGQGPGQGHAAGTTPPTNRQARLDALQSMLAMVDRSIDDGSQLPWEPPPPPPPPPAQFYNQFADFKFPQETEGMDLSSSLMAPPRAAPLMANISSSARVVEPCDRRAIVFSLDDIEELSSDEPPPEVFEITMHDVQAQLRDIKEINEDRAMLPEAYVKQKDFERKLEAWPISVIRIRMPDRTVLQAAFRSLELVGALYKFMEDSLQMPSSNFQLYLPPNVAVDEKSQTLLQAGLTPAANLLFKHTGRAPALQDGYLSKCLMDSSLKSSKEADRIAEECLSENGVYTPYRPPPVSGQQAQGQASLPPSGYRGGPSSAGHSRQPPQLPKWMAKGKK